MLHAKLLRSFGDRAGVTCQLDSIFPTRGFSEASMLDTVVPIFIAVSAVVTYILELWTGFAVASFQSSNPLVDRRTKPGPYWFVMAVQTMVLIIVPIIVAMTR